MSKSAHRPGVREWLQYLCMETECGVSRDRAAARAAIQNLPTSLQNAGSQNAGSQNAGVHRRHLIPESIIERPGRLLLLCTIEA